MVLGVQKPAWHLPMPCLTLRFTPSRDTAPNVLLMESIISPSLTPSQRQIIVPYSGLCRISSALSYTLIFSGRTIPRRSRFQSFF